MTTKQSLVLDQAQAEPIAEKLNVLLADYSIFYQNARNYHWNITGRRFFELHQKFEELYEDLKLKIDEVAERILTLGFTPEHRYSAYIQKATIKEAEIVTDGEQAVNEIMESLRTLIDKEKEIGRMADEAYDNGTQSQLDGYIEEQEKLIWMYNAYRT
jgi:starvation-inducible DNA-binding protein